MDCIVQQAVLETLVLRYAWHFAHNTGPFGEGGLYHVAGVQAPKDVPWSRYTYWVATRPMVADPPALWQRYLSLRRDLQNVYAVRCRQPLDVYICHDIASSSCLNIKHIKHSTTLTSTHSLTNTHTHTHTHQPYPTTTVKHQHCGPHLLWWRARCSRICSLTLVRLC